MSESDNVRIEVMSEADNVRAQKNEISKKKKRNIKIKKWNLKKRETSKKNQIKKISKLRNFTTQKISGSDNASVRQCQAQIMSGSS